MIKYLHIQTLKPAAIISGLLLLALVLFLPAPASSETNSKHVLVLHSYHSGMSWVSNIEKAIRDTLLEPPFEDLILHIEYMDTKRKHDKEHYEILRKLLEEKFKNIKLSLILASDNNAFDFLKENRDSLFPDVPVIFCGVNDFSDSLLKGKKGFTGVAEVMSSQETVETILKQLPKTKEIFIINDYLKTGRAWQSAISKKLKPFEKDVNITYNDNLSIEELRAKIQSLKPGTVVLLGVYYSDRNGDYFTFEKLGSMLTSDSPVPVYCLLRFNLRDGVIGGKVISGYHQGVMMSEVARQVLSGKNPDEIPVVNIGANAFIFDWEGINKNKIKLSTIPPESTIINQPFSFYKEYFWLVWGTVFVFSAMTVMMLILIRNLSELRKARTALINSENKYRSIFDNAKEGLFQTSFDGRVIAANNAIAKMFGFKNPQNLLKTITNVNDIYSEISDRNDFIRNINKYGKISGLELRMHRQDGTELWAQVNARKARAQDGTSIIEGSLVDISERKEAQDKLLKAKESLEETNKALRTSMSHMRTLLNTIPELVWLKDTNGIYIFCNPRFERYFGVPESKIIGHTDYDFVDRQQADLFRENDLKTIEQRKPALYEEIAIYKDGHIEELESIKSPMFDENGTIVGVLGVARDITQRKATENELNRLRNYLFNIINYMPSILVGVDTEQRITLWNRTAEKDTGVSADSAQGKLLKDVMPHITNISENISESIRSKISKRSQRVPRRTETGTRYEDITIYPLSTDNADGAVIRIDDVTDRINLEELMVQTEKMLSVGGLAAGMAHEINNPLSAIVSGSQNLINRLSRNTPKNIEIAEQCDCPFEKIKEYAEVRGCLKALEGIHEAGVRAGDIIQDMLSFSRKSEKEFSLHSPLDLVEDALKLVKKDYDLQKNYDFKQIDIIREYDPDVPSVLCAKNEIRQVLLNIFKNAAQAMAEKEYTTESPKFILGLKNAGDTAVITIEDNGPGMTEEIRKRILEPFYTTKEVGKGTGLGLSVSYFIITDLHKGSMEVFSEPGKWTRFVIKLPFNGTGINNRH